MRHASTLAFATISLLIATPAARAQSLASRIGGAGDGAVTFHFAARPGVCGDGEDNIRMGRSSFVRNSGMSDASECVPGPVQVRVQMHDGVPERIETWVGPLRDRNARDLGAVSAVDASNWLLDAAAHGSRHAADDAMVPAVLADSAVPWPGLLRIARADVARGKRGGSSAAFWLSRFAAAAANGHGANSLDNEDERRTKSDDEEMKVQAVFVLSQRPREEAIPGLLRVAKTNADARVRASAIFWLGQTGDARALDWFEQLLKGAR